MYYYTCYLCIKCNRISLKGYRRTVDVQNNSWFIDRTDLRYFTRFKHREEDSTRKGVSYAVHTTHTIQSMYHFVYTCTYLFNSSCMGRWLLHGLCVYIVMYLTPCRDVYDVYYVCLPTPFLRNIYTYMLIKNKSTNYYKSVHVYIQRWAILGHAYSWWIVTFPFFV